MSSSEDRCSNIYMQAPFKNKPEHWDINLVVL